MPALDPASMRATSGQYAARQSDGRCVASHQRLLRRLARESANRSEQGSRSLAVVYVAALLSQQVVQVSNSSRRPPERSRNGRHDAESSVSLGGVVAVSSERTPTASTSPSAVKSQLFAMMAQFLLQNAHITQALADHLMLAWHCEDMGMPVCVAPITRDLLPARDKRISFETQQKQVIDHIERNCAVETEIMDSEGLSEGKLMIFKAQRAENPFRMLYDNLPAEELSQTARGIADGLNYFADVVTLGIKPAIGGLIAAYFRHRYFEDLDDDICSARQRHLAFALLASSLDIQGVRLGGMKPKLMKQPLELANQVPFESKAVYFLNNKQTGKDQFEF